MDMKNKTAVITGGAQGFGKGFAGAVLENGGNVVIADVATDRALRTVNEFHSTYGPGRVMFIKCDVTSERDMQDVLWKSRYMYGGVDIMVNNAGISDETMNTLLVNLHGVILGTRYALQVMSKDEGGRGGVIVNIASTAGLAVVPFSPVYSASKFGVVGYSRCVAARAFETTEQGIRVVCLCPSFTKTDMFTGDLQDTTLQASVAGTGIMEIPRVVSAFVKLVTDANNNGGVLAVTPKELEYKYPRRWKGKL